MDFDTLRPIVSGLIGGAVATWITSKSHKWLPKTYNSKTQSELLSQNRISRYVAVAVFFGGLFGGVLAYSFGLFKSTDATGLAIFFGIAFGAPLLIIPAIAKVTSRNPWEALAAYAISESLPPVLHQAISIAALCSLFWGITKLI